MAISGKQEVNNKIRKKCIENLKSMPEIFYDFFSALEASGKAYKTIHDYLGHLKEFAEFYCELTGVPIDEFYKSVRAKDVNRYFSKLKEIDEDTDLPMNSNATCAKKWSCLNSFFCFLTKHDYIKRNPMDVTERPHAKHAGVVTVLTDEEVTKILADVEYYSNSNLKLRNKLIVYMGVVLGLRMSEIVQMNVSDIDFNNNTINIIAKRDKYRVVYFGNNLKAFILQWLEIRASNFPSNNTDAFIVNKYGARCTTDTVKELMRRYADGINGKHITAHKMRSTAATNVFNANKDIYETKEFLGHTSIETTLRYIHSNDENKRKTSKYMDAMIK